MKLASESFKDGASIPEKCAFAKIDRSNHTTPAGNKNPQLGWSGLPDGTKSLVVICHDPDVPTKFNDANQEGRTISKDLPRQDFYHWVLVDLKPDGGAIREGEFSDGVIEGGKSGPEGPRGTRQGLNNYTGMMGGQWFGYDGPCPPWNDEIPHRYVFTVYALDVEKCPVNGTFTAQDALKAIKGHILDKASITGKYTLNPDVKL